MDRRRAGWRLIGLIPRAKGWEQSILGCTLLNGNCFQPVFEVERGPLAALRDFVTTSQVVFLIARDVSLFPGAIVRPLVIFLGEMEASIPILGGRVQPLAACIAPGLAQASRS